MDHIVAVDTTTRALVAQGQRPVTVGLFFSLGHSTIVLAMTVAIIITVRAIDKLPDISSVGGVIGVSVSASFLFLLGESPAPPHRLHASSPSRPRVLMADRHAHSRHQRRHAVADGAHGSPQGASLLLTTIFSSRSSTR